MQRPTPQDKKTSASSTHTRFSGTSRSSSSTDFSTVGGNRYELNGYGSGREQNELPNPKPPARGPENTSYFPNAESPVFHGRSNFQVVQGHHIVQNSGVRYPEADGHTNGTYTASYAPQSVPPPSYNGYGGPQDTHSSNVQGPHAQQSRSATMPHAQNANPFPPQNGSGQTRRQSVPPLNPEYAHLDSSQRGRSHRR
ncbi:hypothetical protein BDP27DRAFT_663113 [Rhodocollybia butyracea]|uniref:Uncharacterized protein n=1 Tax=Rhodocollybia butyracea TaxID=206335 RepID=A0A9P5U8H3_9AGAR|nr:hypothetical protein BDP27DRAFT_663113 [Rhodocollybia butyracea]